MVYKPNEESKFYVKYHKVFFDFETITVGTHKPYLVCWDDENNGVGTYYNEKTMLNNLPDYENIMLIAHNANYDVRFLLHLLFAPKPIIKDNRFIAIDALYFKFGNPNKKINLRIKDSYKLIEMALAKFPKAFNLPITKEVMPYNLYTESNIKTCFIPIKTAKYFIKNDDEKQLEDNIDKWDLRRDDDTYDIVEYSKIYCQLDCSVLKKGYEAYRKIMLDVIGLDVDNYCTIQGLALDYVLKEGCFDGVFMLSGVPQQYISNCVVGGRCMTNDNKMYHVVGKLADFDATALYSSSLHRIDGFLMGTPKVLKTLTQKFLDSVDGYFIRIEILSVGKKLMFPLLSKIDEYGVRIFTNDMVNEVVFIDKVGLEDAIKYQDIKFKIIDGYYFDEGRNDNINKAIKHLFDTRKKMKAENNPAEKNS